MARHVVVLPERPGYVNSQLWVLEVRVEKGVYCIKPLHVRYKVILNPSSGPRAPPPSSDCKRDNGPQLRLAPDNAEAPIPFSSSSLQRHQVSGSRAAFV